MKSTIQIDAPSSLWRWLTAGLGALLIGGLAVNYFSGNSEEPAPSAELAAAAVATQHGTAPKPTSFPAVKLALLATAPDGESPQADIEVEGRRGSYKAGQDITAGIRLNTVESDHVVLAFAGSTRILWGAAQGKQANEEAPDIRERNRAIEVNRLTAARPKMADAFLREVLVKPNPRGGYEVESVTPGSVYAKMGLRPGDVVFSLDTPKMAAVDENNMIALTMQTEIELDVHRNGQPIRLRRALNVDDGEAGAAAPAATPPSSDER